MQTILEKCPFKENGKLSELFRLVLRGLNLAAVSNTQQNKILRGIRPRRRIPCGVSDPAEQWQSCVHFIAYTCSAGSDTPQNNVLRGPIQIPAGYQTPRNKVLRGIKPRETTFKNEYCCEFEKEFKNILGCKFGDNMGSIRGKNQR
jgi:hypothetical protein